MSLDLLRSGDKWTAIWRTISLHEKWLLQCFRNEKSQVCNCVQRLLITNKAIHEEFFSKFAKKKEECTLLEVRFLQALDDTTILG